MSSRANLALSALAALVIVTGARADGTFSMNEVSPGVWAALQQEPLRFNDSNSVVIITDRDVVVVDSQANPASSRELIAWIEAKTDRPVRYLINTHFHSDHTRANFVYRDRFPGIEIVGHATLIEDVPARSAPDLERELALYRTEIPAGEKRLEEGISRNGEALDDAGKATLAGQIEAAKAVFGELESIRWEVPSLGPADAVTLHRSVGPIEIRPVQAHTRGDLVVHLPQAGVLITGDVLDDLPYGGHGYPTAWVEVLSELEALDWEVLIPGHGRVRRGAEAREHLVTVRSLFELMVASTRRSVESGLDLEGARTAFHASESLGPIRSALIGEDPVASGAFDDFVPAGFERAFLEASGRLTD